MWLLICVKLDDTELEKLSRTRIWLIIRTFVGLQRFWQLRTVHLLSRELVSRVVGGCWRQAYHLIRESIEQGLFSRIRHCVDSELAIRVLLEVGTNPNLSSNLSIIRAARDGRTEVMRLLLEYRSETHPDGISITRVDTALRFAREAGHTEIERMLLADPRTRALVGS